MDIDIGSEQLENLLTAIGQKNELQMGFLKNSVNLLSNEEIQDLNRYIVFLGSLGLDISYIADCYNLIVKDTLREQLYFRKHKRYRHSTFAAVSENVYFKKSYMDMYMYGLALTLFLWPNHLQLSRWYHEKLPHKDRGKYLEVGPGHGYFFMSAMRKSNYSSFKGVDISPASVEMTEAVLSSRLFGDFSKYEIVNADFLTLDEEEKYDAIVMGEVLEHVEEPFLFLEKIARIAEDDAFIYITTAINSPAIDHIFHFDSPQAVRKIVENAGLMIKDELLIPYQGLSLQESQEQYLPVNIALVLGK
ncbi:MAG: class I SAM-dependent methyltransferase [Syntrophomonas sp.]